MLKNRWGGEGRIEACVRGTGDRVVYVYCTWLHGGRTSRKVSGLCHKIRGSLVEPQSHASYRDARAASVGRRWKFRRSRYDFGWSCGDIVMITSRRWRDRGHRGIHHGRLRVIGIYAPTLNLFSVGGYVQKVVPPSGL